MTIVGVVWTLSNVQHLIPCIKKYIDYIIIAIMIIFVIVIVIIINIIIIIYYYYFIYIYTHVSTAMSLRPWEHLPVHLLTSCTFVHSTKPINRESVDSHLDILIFLMHHVPSVTRVRCSMMKAARSMPLAVPLSRSTP